MSVIIKIFKKNEESIIEDTEYEFSLNEKIIDIKNKILKESFNESYNYLNMENITDKVFKDYGKLFFDKGPIPEIIDNYKLEQMTNGNRVFSFLCIPINKELQNEKQKVIQKNESFPKINNKQSSMKSKFFPDNNNHNQFKFNENDFPALS